MVRARLPFLAIGVAVVVAGCGHAAPTGGLPGASSATSAAPSGGEPAPSATPNPAGDVPAGFPVPPGAQPAEAGPGMIAAWTSDADPPAVYDHFLAALPAAGFRLDEALPGGEAAVIRFTAPGGVAYQLNLVGRGPLRIELGPPRP